MRKLYVIRVESEFVFASNSDDPRMVEVEFSRALHTDIDLGDELENGDVSASPMDHLPGDYELDALPWGDNDDEKTIGEMIAEGAAPKYTEMQQRFADDMAKIKGARDV